MSRLHVVSGDPRHANRLDDGTIEIGYWALYPTDAERMVGGTLYLHRTKGRGAYDAGQVVTVRIATEGEARPGHVVFRYRPITSLRRAPWEGEPTRDETHGAIIEETLRDAAA